MSPLTQGLNYRSACDSLTEFEPKVSIFDNDNDEANYYNVEQTLTLFL